MALFDQATFSRALDELNEETQRSELGPTKKQSLSRITITCLLLNRMIGTGIFIVPADVVRATGSVGISILLWAVGGVLALCGTYVWLELGLSTPRHSVRGERLSVPRSGGEKNYLEYIYNRPERLATCMFGIAFIVIGNRAGNAYAFGIYVLNAAGYESTHRGAVIGIALAGLAFTAGLHMFTRSGGILINNMFGIFKAGLLLAMIILGAIKATGHDLGGGLPASPQNYDHAFTRVNNDAVGIANAFQFIIYAYGGFEQPFYVLSEFGRPRKWFPWYTTGSIVLVTLLFVGVNVVYFLVVPLEDILANRGDIATLFFDRIFGGSDKAQRSMSALIAVAILGNLVVTTFTMSRVKQEIAKEGILPWSLFWATSHTTPAAKISSWFRRNIQRKPTKANLQEDHDHQEQAPMAALMLNLISAFVLVAVTAFLQPYTSYQFLVGLYTYVLIVLVGFFVAGGMLVLKLTPRRNWSRKTYFKNVPLVLGLIPATFYFLVCFFLLVVAFVTPVKQPPYKYYIVPIIGLSAPLWGLVWWLGLHLRMRKTNTRLVVSRVPYVVPDPDNQGEFIQKAELIDHEWHSSLRQRRPVAVDAKNPMIRVDHVDRLDQIETAYHSRYDVSPIGADRDRNRPPSPGVEPVHSLPSRDEPWEYSRNWASGPYDQR